MSAVADFDRMGIDELRAGGSVKWSRFGSDVIGAWVAEMDFGTAPEITTALHGAVTSQTFGYLPPGLVAAMGEAAAGYFDASYGWVVEPEWVRPVPDVLAALVATIRHFTPPASPIVVPTPAYMPFREIPGELGRELIEVPMIGTPTAPHYDLEAIDRALAAGAGLVVVCNPHNPLGVVTGADELAEIAAVVECHGARVFADEIHAPIRYGEVAHVPYSSVSAAAAGHSVTATSASKAWNVPGLKCAQLVFTAADDRALWSEVGFHDEFTTANLGVVATIAAYRSGRPWLDDVLGYLDGNRRLFGELLAEHLPEVTWRMPDATYLAWLDCRAIADRLGANPATAFLERGRVGLTDGALCGAPGFVRLNLATPRPILREIVARMSQAVRCG